MGQYGRCPFVVADAPRVYVRVHARGAVDALALASPLQQACFSSLVAPISSFSKPPAPHFAISARGAAWQVRARRRRGAARVRACARVRADGSVDALVVAYALQQAHPSCKAAPISSACNPPPPHNALATLTAAWQVRVRRRRCAARACVCMQVAHAYSS